MHHRIAVLSVLTGLVAGCFSENVDITNLEGRLTIPRAAATITPDVTGVEETDVRAIGPVFVGLYPSIRYDLAAFPRPERSISTERASLPYGGTTIGDYRNACLEALQCRAISGRFADFDDLLDWFAFRGGEAVTDAFGNEITTGELIRQTCFELLNYTSDDEIRLTGDLDFVENDDGDFVADFEILQQEFVPGMSVWAFHDAPSTSNLAYTTCDPEEGFLENTYNRDYQVGLAQPDVLNQPQSYLLTGDWVTAVPFIWETPSQIAELSVDFQVGVDDVADARTAAEAAGVIE